MTFSLVARCPDTGMFGTAIASSSPAVAARCSYAQAGVGAVSTQNVTDPRLGPLTLAAMRSGLSAPEALKQVIEAAEYTEYRQVLAVDQHGNTAIHSGHRSLGIWSEAQAGNVASGGNLLANDRVPQAIVDGFLSAKGSLGNRLIAAMQQGLAAGGEAGPIHSAGILLVDKYSWPLAELRCDWVDEGCPIQQIARAWEVYQPQINDYVKRALDPREAPSYGVPGDE
ncbi:MAG: DUF1028 domain-containing protein [Thiolinea sp.]